MECRNKRISRQDGIGSFHDLSHPFGHLFGDFVRESDRNDPERRHAAIQKMGDPIGQSPRFARPGAGYDTQITGIACRGFALLFVQFGKNVHMRFSLFVNEENYSRNSPLFL